MALELSKPSFWRNLVENDNNSCVKLVHKKLHLSFPPYYLGDIKERVKSVVDSRLIQYIDELGGILAGYGKLTITKPNAETFFNLGDIHVEVEGDFFIFTPEIGQELVGTINRKTTSHIGCIVHHLFNVSLPRPYNVQNSDWIAKSAQLQQNVKFIITQVNFQSQVPYIEGNIKELLGYSKEVNENAVISLRKRTCSDSGVSIMSEDSSAADVPDSPMDDTVDSIPSSSTKKSNNIVVELQSNLCTKQDAVEQMNTLPVSAFKQVNKKSDEKTKKRKRQVDSPVIHETPKIKKLKLATDESPVVKSNLVSQLFTTNDREKNCATPTQVPPTKSKKRSSKHSAPNDNANGNEHHQTPSRNAENSEISDSILDVSVDVETPKAGVKKKSKKHAKKSKSDSTGKVDQDHESVIQQMLASTLYKNTNPKVNSSNVNSGSTLEANEAKKVTSTPASSGKDESSKKGTKKSDNKRKKKIKEDLPSEKGILRVVQPESSSKLATTNKTSKKKKP